MLILKSPMATHSLNNNNKKNRKQIRTSLNGLVALVFQQTKKQIPTIIKQCHTQHMNAWTLSSFTRNVLFKMTNTTIIFNGYKATYIIMKTVITHQWSFFYWIQICKWCEWGFFPLFEHNPVTHRLSNIYKKKCQSNIS